MNIRLITLWQPYASLCALGLKVNETRHWRTHYRGELLIHAAQRKMTAADKAVWNEAIALAREAGDTRDFPPVDELPLQQVLCLTNLSDCIEMTDSLIQAQTPLERAVGNWKPGRYAWTLEHLHTLAEPIALVGQQGLKPAPAHLQEQVREAIATWKQGYSDAWVEGAAQSTHPEYLAGWRTTCEEASRRDFAEVDRLINKYAP